ncbi:MAG: class I SAM-dependent methyltransferase [Alphaproteobacteria bacterium]|nr:class I SAM-dependent methyltransferase [Alphaproteobacteria bacterium]
MNNTNFDNMSYVDFISFLQETNRCPGGKDTINWILRNSFASKDSNVLEIGSNTGFSSLEVARLLHCNVLGIDVAAKAVETAKQELMKDTPEIQKLVKFQVGSAYDIPCATNTVDLIIAGGSTSFMDDKSQAVSEMYRVLKNWGFCSVTNLCYHQEPPKQLLKAVSDIIGVEIKYTTEKDWIDLYTKSSNFEVYKFESVKLAAQSDDTISAYIDFFMQKPHIACLSPQDQVTIRRKWADILAVFNENHKYLSFIRCLLRKRAIPEEPELFKIEGHKYAFVNIT